MELRQLVYVEAVARLGGFSRAAESLHVAQPAVSAQIRRLERELGVTLFTRTTRRVALTAAGRVVVRRARAAMAEIDGVRTDLDELTGAPRGTLRLGVTPLVGSLDLPSLVSGFHRHFPDVALQIEAGLIGGLLASLADARVDCVLGPVHDDLADRFVARRLVPERVVLITPAGTLPAAPAGVRLDVVRDRPFVCLPRGSGLHDILLSAARRCDFVPNVPFEAPDPAGVRAFVAAGLGVAVLAESAARRPGPEVDVYTLRPSPPHPPIGLIRRRADPPSPVLRAWQDHLLAHRSSA